jgi:hypothetical protein
MHQIRTGEAVEEECREEVETLFIEGSQSGPLLFLRSGLFVCFHGRPRQATDICTAA